MRLALRAAERYDRHHKPKGARNGPLGHVGLEVYRALWAAIRFRDGCLCPSIEWIMKTCRRSRCAVVGALKRLKAKGFVAWRRRLEYTGGPRGVRGPQVKQATNAYGLGVPGAALQLVGNVTIPDDERTRICERAAEVAGFEREAFNQSPLGQAVARLGASLQQRESAGRSQSLPKAPLASARSRSAT